MVPMPKNILEIAGGQCPTVGRIVIFSDSEGREGPAIITRVHSWTCVNLQFFQDAWGVLYRPNVEKLDRANPHIDAWRWPGENFPATTASGTASGGEPDPAMTPPPPPPAEESVPLPAEPAPQSDPTPEPAEAN